jgi:sugar/nucleoside kinase (ribokinase family)
MSILVLGTVALDSVKTPHGLKKDLLGGSAVHFSMSARLFTPVHLVAVIGEDFPAKHIQFLREKGIDVTSLKIIKGKTFRWQGEYQDDCNNAITIATELGVLTSFKPEVAIHQKKIKNIFLANVDPDIQKHLLESMQKPQLVGLDSMNYWINNKKKQLISLLKKVDLFVANDQEARSLTGEHNLIKAGSQLLRLGPDMVVIKKGEHGVIFLSKDILFSLPAYPVEEVIDPTGAGDTFAGGLMGYLASKNRITNQAIKNALYYATVCASFNVQGFGVAKTSNIQRQALEKRLREFKAIIS